MSTILPLKSKLLSRANAYGIYHVVNSGVSSYYEFAKETARLLKLDEAEADRLIEKVSEADMSRPARRPRWTPLANTLEPLRSWQEALASYIQDDLVGGE